jgi:hypothetical protein
MEYIFILTYSIMLALMAGVLLGAIVALFSKEHKLKKFQATLCYTSAVVAVALITMTMVNW